MERWATLPGKQSEKIGQTAGRTSNRVNEGSAFCRQQGIAMILSRILLIYSKKFRQVLDRQCSLWYNRNEFYGALAQLGARNIRIVKVTGSNPVCSTTGVTLDPISSVSNEFYFYKLHL